jgi:hydroxymethylpyrimidine/phosphomethylpyrimidine kinase
VTRRPLVALTIAGSDPSGGAGVQADLACFLALGVHGASALTALTAQSARGISGVHEVPPDFVGEQIRRVCGDLDVGAAKTGMLAGAETVAAVARAVAGCGLRNLVVDPVMVSSGGTRLLAPEAVAVLLAELFPLALIVTPNLAEAEALTGAEVRDRAGMRAAARALHARGPRWVLVTGGHLVGPAVDVLFDGESFIELEAERIAGPAERPDLQDLHGTGCVLSAAIAAHLARGASVPDAVAAAKAHATGAIAHGLDFGAAGACVDPAWSLRAVRAGEPAARPSSGSSRRARTAARPAGSGS